MHNSRSQLANFCKVLILMVNPSFGVAKPNLKMLQVEAELKRTVKNFRRAQSNLKKLREIGANETDIQHVMNLMGFGAVTPDEFLLARTGEEIGRIVLKLRRLDHTGSANLNVQASGCGALWRAENSNPQSGLNLLHHRLGV